VHLRPRSSRISTSYICMYGRSRRGGGGAACICGSGSRRNLVLVEQVNSAGEAVGGAVIGAAACTCGSALSPKGIFVGKD
jgi:hypothetical protein